MPKATKKEAVVTAKTPKELEELLATKQADLLGYRKGLAAGELKNPGVIKTTRRDIARIKTALSTQKAAGKEGDK